MAVAALQLPVRVPGLHPLRGAGDPLRGVRRHLRGQLPAAGDRVAAAARAQPARRAAREHREEQGGQGAQPAKHGGLQEEHLNGVQFVEKRR